MKINTYTCLDCLEEFEEPRLWTQTHGLDPPYESWYGCPSCGGPYVTTHLCDCCDGRIVSEYVKLRDGGEYCPDCFDERMLGED